MTPSATVREKILKTASILFLKQGYNSTGINQIIDEAAIARGSLYNHFKSKTDLLHAYLIETNDNWFTQLEKYLERIESPREKILALFDFRIERQILNDFGGCPFIKAGSEIQPEDKVAFEIIDRNKMRFRDLILSILEDISPKTDLLSRAEIADMIYLLAEGATVTASFQKNKMMLSRAREIAGKML